MLTAHESRPECVDALVHLALESGARDNVSAIVIDVVPRSDPATAWQSQLDDATTRCGTSDAFAAGPGGGHVGEPDGARIDLGLARCRGQRPPASPARRTAAPSMSPSPPRAMRWVVS